MEKRLFEPGAVICKEHEIGNEMFFILKGSARPFKTINNQKVELSPLEKGTFFGEMCLFSRNTRAATIVALEPTEVLVLNKDTLLEKLQTDPRMGVTIIETLIRRLEFAHDRIEKLEGLNSSFKMMYEKK